MKILYEHLERLQKVGRITPEIREEFFKGLNFLQIRNALEENGIDRHTPIDLISTEVAILTPEGIFMQSRPSDNGQLGMWGGVVNDGEEPIDGAVRELKEELGLDIAKEQLVFVEVDNHYHKYANGDKAYFQCYRYILKLETLPQVVFDSETSSAVMVRHTIISHQQNFIKHVLGEI